MKVYLSYWRGGWQQKPSEFVINMHKISTFLAQKHFKEVHFLTDEQSKEDFKDILFDSVDIIFNDLDIKYKNVWSVSKLIAYDYICKKGDPFIHIDYDVFLWNGIPERLYNADVFAQCEEYNSYHWYGIEKFLQHCPKPYLIGEVDPKPLHGINVGIFGGNNLDFIQKYSQSSLDIIFDKENEDFFFGENVFDNHWNRAVITEQYNLACACSYYKVKPELYFKNGWPGNKEANDKFYTHLMGAKHNKGVKEKINLLAQNLKDMKQEQIAVDVLKTDKEEEDKKIKKIIKVFGLPKTGSNLMEKLLILNFKNYVCQHADHHPDYHYLGWKHGLPRDMKVYDAIERHKKERVYFVFMVRNFEQWEKSYFTNHFNSWEFPDYYFDMGWDTFIYNSPEGPILFKNTEDLYRTYNTEYQKFADLHKDRCIIVHFEDLIKNQKEVIKNIQDKFNFELSQEEIYELKKRTDSGGRINDFIW